MRRFIVALMVVAFTACVEDGEQKQPTSNHSIPVTLLFEHDDCRVYRFLDGSHYHYYAVCRGADRVSVSDRESCGKNCTREREMSTVQSDDPVGRGRQ